MGICIISRFVFAGRFTGGRRPYPPLIENALFFS